MSKEKAEFALYKGEEVLGIGTADELAAKFNVTPKTIVFYASPTHHRRVDNSVDPENALLAVRVEDDDDESE